MQKNKTILVVDDDLDLLESTVDIIKSIGYDVITGTNGEEAVAKFKEKMPNLVLMDIKMPKMDGFEAFFQIKKIYPDAKVIFITGNEIDNEKYLKAKAVTLILVVTKPYSAEFLKEIIIRYS
jgi:two-component system chemotaxis response regulator CheY